MTKPATFTVELEEGLRADFLAAAEASHRPPADVLHDLMRDYVREQGAYHAFLERKVAAARQSVRTGQGRSDAVVEADFAARRARIAGEA